MDSRSDKYSELSKRTERHKDLYNSYNNQSLDKFDVDSNQEILTKDARRIDVDQIKSILDERYRDDSPKRKSISLDTPVYHEDEKEITKEYDLNNVIKMAKSSKQESYDDIRLNKGYSGSELVKEIHDKYDHEHVSAAEKELQELINTITELEIKNKDANLLGLEETKTDLEEEIEEAEEEINEEVESEDEEDFYTGKLKVDKKDFDDLDDLEDDIKSNSKLIKLLVFIFILILVAIGIVIANNIFNWELF